MKKTITSILFLLAILSVHAQEIKFRRLIEPEGLSIMTTQYLVYSFGQSNLHYALQYEESQAEGIYHGYYLHIYFETYNNSRYVPQRGKLLIRTTNDEVISLEDCGEPSFLEYSSEHNRTTSEPRRESTFDSNGVEKYVCHGKYPISAENLKKLIYDGVIKIRIETTAEPIQCEYKAEKKNKTSIALEKLYVLLVSNINPYYGL